MLRFQKFLQIRFPGGLIDNFQLLNLINSTSRKSRKQQRLVLLRISGFDRKSFCLRFWIFQGFVVNRTSWNRIRRYFCHPSICSMCFEFLKVSKNHKGHYRATCQAIFDLMAFLKKLNKFEKYRKNSRIEKIPPDSVSAVQIYLSNLKNQKLVRCQVRTFLNGSFEKNQKKNGKK